MYNLDLCVLLDFTCDVTGDLQTKIPRSVKRCAMVGQPNHYSFIDVHTSRKSVRNVECSTCINISTQGTSQREETLMCFQSSVSCKGEKYTKDSYSKKIANTHTFFMEK